MSEKTYLLGKLGAPRGIKGDLRLQSYSGEFGHLLKLKNVELRGGGRILRLKVARAAAYPDGLATMAFEGYPTPEAARVLTGLEIVASLEDAAPLGANEWYIGDLIGLPLRDEGGRELATVASVIEGAADPMLEAVLPDGRRALVPFRNEFVGKVDVEGRAIELLAPWILEE
jgi:16S rRNA processing protein RimM